MKSYSTTAFSITIKIWLIALCCHTLIGSAFLSNHIDDFFFFAMFGGVIGGFFSTPIFILLWMVLYYFLKEGQPAHFIFKILLTIGIVAAFVASALFLYMGGIGSSRSNDLVFIFLPPACGAVAILLNYQSIQAACLRRDESDLLLHHFDSTAEPNAQP